MISALPRCNCDLRKCVARCVVTVMGQDAPMTLHRWTVLDLSWMESCPDGGWVCPAQVVAMAVLSAAWLAAAVLQKEHTGQAASSLWEGYHDPLAWLVLLWPALGQYSSGEITAVAAQSRSAFCHQQQNCCPPPAPHARLEPHHCRVTVGSDTVQAPALSSKRPASPVTAHARGRPASPVLHCAASAAGSARRPGR